MSQHPVSVSLGNFSLDVSGVAGLFGGDEAVQAIKTIHLYKARRWSGWYNAPGSFAVAKCLGPIANSRFWNALFPGPNEEPEKVFGLDNQSGPKYIASQSGTVIEKTTHVAYLVTQTSKEVLPLIRVKGRKTKPMTLTVVKVTDQQSDTRAPDSISASLTACALCAYNHDWYCFAMILLGIMSNGVTCLVVGSASVVLKGVKPATGAPCGDGMLVDDRSSHIVILKGAEKDVNGVTKGSFCLEYLPRVWMKKRSPNDTLGSCSSTGQPASMSASSDPENASQKEGTKNDEGAPELKEYREIGLCGILLGMQSLLQLLLIPQGTLFGQMMFLSSFIISWVYNLYLSSLDKEKVQQRLLFETLQVGDHDMSRFELGTRTTTAVFATLLLRPSTRPGPASFDAVKLLKRFLPNETVVWNKWREHVGKHIETINWMDGQDVATEMESLITCDDAGLSDDEQRRLLAELLGDARDAFQGYYNSFISSNSGVGGAKNTLVFDSLSQRHSSNYRCSSRTESASTEKSARSGRAGYAQLSQLID